MARNQSALVVWSQYLALRAIAGFTHCFDLDQNLKTAAGLKIELQMKLKRGMEMC